MGQRPVRKIQIQVSPGDQIDTREVGQDFNPVHPGLATVTAITVEPTGTVTVHNNLGGSQSFPQQWVVLGSIEYAPVRKIQAREQDDQVETWEVGEPFFPRHPELGRVTSITIEPTGSYFVHNERGGAVIYLAASIVPDSVEYAELPTLCLSALVRATWPGPADSGRRGHSY